MSMVSLKFVVLPSRGEKGLLNIKITVDYKTKRHHFTILYSYPRPETILALMSVRNIRTPLK